MRCLRRRMPLRSDLSLRISPESRKLPSGFFVYPAEVRLYLQHRFVMKKYPLDAKVLVVAHAGLLRDLHFAIVGYDDDTDFATFKIDNAELKEYCI